MTYAFHSTDRPAPVIHIKMAHPTDVRNDALHMASQACILLSDVRSDTAYLVVEMPRLEVTLLDLTASLASTVKPHGGLEIPYAFGSRACITPPQSGSTLHVVVTGPGEEQYDKLHVQLIETLNMALDLVRQVWSERQFSQLFTGSIHHS